MKVILLENIDRLGDMGEVVDVARGYARNYLIPKGFAQEATPEHMARLEEEMQRRRAMAEERLREAQAQAEQVEGTHLEMSARAGTSGKLFGSVTSKDIGEALEEKTGIGIDRRKIELSEPLRETGDFELTVVLHPEVRVTVQVSVTAQE